MADSRRVELVASRRESRDSVSFSFCAVREKGSVSGGCGHKRGRFERLGRE